MSSETIKIYDKDDNLVDYVAVPEGFMEDAESRWIIVDGKKYVEGGGPDSFYGKGQFAEVD